MPKGSKPHPVTYDVWTRRSGPPAKLSSGPSFDGPRGVGGSFGYQCGLDDVETICIVDDPNEEPYEGARVLCRSEGSTLTLEECR
jgi:hypothetical protein